MREPAALRSYLYAPGARPELLAKAYAAGADAVIFDLEDAVAADDKQRARAAVSDALARIAADRSPGPEVHARINATGNGYEPADLDAVVAAGLDGLRLPKATEPAAVRWVAGELDRREARAGLPPGHVRLYPTVESAAGVLRAGELAAADPRVARLAFGAADFLTDIGAAGTAHGPATWTARGQLVLASRAAGIAAPVDSVHTALQDDAGLREGAALARELGFFGKAVVHPAQLSTVHEIFTPAADELAWARRVAAAAAGSPGAFDLDGELVDAPVLARARSLLALADRLPACDPTRPEETR